MVIPHGTWTKTLNRCWGTRSRKSYQVLEPLTLVHCTSSTNHAGRYTVASAGKDRSSQETLAQVKEQVHVACLGVAASVEKLQASTGVKDAYTQHWIDDLIARARSLKKANPDWSANDIQEHLQAWVDENEAIIYNPFLTLEGFDAARDTPVEILHTILLGVIKYTWRASYTSWNASQKALYATRLQATIISGLGDKRAIRAKYITQYANSLIGRQLKVLSQVNAFHVYDIVSDHQFLMTKAVGELSALLWYPEIRNMDQYIADVTVAAENVLDIAALVDPSKIVCKIKYHLLTHLTQDIKRFGPLAGVASEVYEAFNGIFRYCSIFSNHLSPSRDIALQLAGQESVKHILCGGWWRIPASSDSGVAGAGSHKWVCPGPSLQAFMLQNSTLKSLVGRPSGESLTPGAVQLVPVKRAQNQTKLPRQAFEWSKTLCSSTHNHQGRFSHLQWYQGKSVVSRAGDTCDIGAWVFAQSLSQQQDGNHSNQSLPIITGKIIEILHDASPLPSYSLVALDVFQVAHSRHEVFGVPILFRRMNQSSVTIVEAKVCNNLPPLEAVARPLRPGCSVDGNLPKGLPQR
ncbi:hypothetical protein BJ165DRAFT_1524159 [Panaeolus papilionaceus]|nr:hypothetical protein BJ165DRAFT_1524159 [Panaeolus papilionaceus]